MKNSAMKSRSMKLLVLFALLLMCTHALALTATVNGITWTYTVSNGEASVGGGSSSSPAVPRKTKGAIKIPSELGGFSVTSIGNYAFSSCSQLTSVTIPNIYTKMLDKNTKIVIAQLGNDAGIIGAAFLGLESLA